MTPLTSLNKNDLIEFEKEIAGLYESGAIRAPVHLRSGREDMLIEIFENIRQQDWVFGYWDSHELALLKGVSRDELKQAILEGRSISLCFPRQKVYCSGIVGSLVGVSVGAALAIKKRGLDERVIHFCGDMSAETGIFHEAVKYATHWDLPIVFVVCDNGLSVMTKTREAWNSHSAWWFEDLGQKIVYFKYENGYPHSGLGKLIAF